LALPLPASRATAAGDRSPRDDRAAARHRRAASLVALGDAAELRSRGVEVAHAADRPLAALALVVGLDSDAEAEGLEGSEELRVERDGATVAIWRPEPGNIMFSAAGFDRFRTACADLLAQVGEHREDPAVAAV
jgi:hypothetical protein